MSRASVELRPHPGAAVAPAVTIAVTVERTSTGLRVRYELAGEVAAVRWPPEGPAERVDGLWRHTCFELFCAVPGQGSYYEFNFSPSGAWALYRFGGYRERLADPSLARPPAIVTMRDVLAVAVEVDIDMTGLPRLSERLPLDIALAAVIEQQGGGLGYFALGHPAEQADFHDRRGFLVTLAGYGQATQ